MLDILGKHKNIVAVKLTCGGIAKVARISAAFEKSEFVALAGQSDWLVPALSVGGVGTITGVANLYPKVCNHVQKTLVRLEANRLGLPTSIQSLPIGQARRSVRPPNQTLGYRMGVRKGWYQRHQVRRCAQEGVSREQRGLPQALSAIHR
jgi:hypothetical protein